MEKLLDDVKRIWASEGCSVNQYAVVQDILLKVNEIVDYLNEKQKQDNKKTEQY